MRVLHITTEYPPIIYGGLGTAVGGLVKASALAGIEVAVLLVGHGNTPGYSTPTNTDTSSEAVGERQLNVAIWAVPHSVAIPASIEFAQRWCPDVIHVHVFWLAHVATAIRNATGAPLVYTVHSLDRAEYELGQGPAECVSQWPIQFDLICSADRVIALTDDERNLIGEYCPEVSERIRVVGNGIADHAHARRDSHGALEAKPITVLYSGRFVERKGIRELLEAVPAFLQADRKVRLVMAGGHRHAKADEVADYWLPQSCRPFRDRILFTGWLTPEEVATWYQEADILVVPSWYEPFGMVILEGMLSGLAIVASLVGGPKEILKSGMTGLFCLPKDAASLAAQVIRLIADPELRIRIGRQAAQDVRLHWLHEHVLKKMKDVYREVASPKVDSLQLQIHQ